MDARIIKTKKKIQEALFLILQNKKIHEVSISEICKKANINRNTFYAHFSTPETVLDSIAEEYLSEQYNMLNRCSTTKEIVVTACKYIALHKKKNLILLENLALESFVARGVDYAAHSMLYVVDNKEERFTPEEIHMIHTYICSGAVAIIMDWLYSGMKESPEIIGERIDYITTRLVKGINEA